MRNKTLVVYYISVMKRSSKKLLSITDIVVADAFFSTSTFEKGISEFGFYLVSRFRDNTCHLANARWKVQVVLLDKTLNDG